MADWMVCNTCNKYVCGHRRTQPEPTSECPGEGWTWNPNRGPFGVWEDADGNAWKEPT